MSVTTVNFNLNSNASKRFYCIDNFYEDPDAVRSFALQQNFISEIYYRGKRTPHRFIAPGTKERFEQIIGQPITRWEEHGMNGRFQLCTADDALVYHCDEQRWAGMVYLTPDAPPQCGTTMYRHKKTKVRHMWDPEFYKVFKNYGDDVAYHLDETPFEPVDVLGNVYNRLVIFDGGNLHAASKYFGRDVQTGRLFHMFFFD